MKALVLVKRRSGNILRHEILNTPMPKRGEALVKVAYGGFNHLDLLIQQGKRVGPVSFPHILGSEIVGKVAKIEGSNKKISVGSDVAVYPWIFCRKCLRCKTGNENICDQGGTIGRTVWGGYAEYVAVPIQNIIKIPSGLRKALVCGLILAGTTAYHLLDRARINNKSVVLVTGATGGVGTIVIQLLKHKKCTIICTTSSKAKASMLKRLGADYVVSTENFKDEIMKLFPNGVDYVVDIMGGYIWSEAIETLAKNGTIVFCATTFDNLGVINIGKTFAKQLNILGSYAGRIKDLKATINLFKKGLINPVIDSILPFSKAELGFKKLAAKKAFGKIILKFSSA